MIHHARTVRPAAHALCAALMGAALLVPVLAMAEDDALTTAVKACAAIGKNAERLACYDSRAYPIAAGATAVAAPLPTPEEVFGAESSAPAPPPAAATTAGTESAPAPAREELSKITAHVTAMTTSPRGLVQLELDNGQVWRQIDPHELLLHAGDSVTIARAAFGSFRMTTQGGRVSKVERVR